MEITLTKDNFETEVLDAKVPVLVDFWATWCGPCRMVAPVVEAIAEEYEGRMKVGKVNVDDAMQVAMDYSIVSIPTLMLFKDGEEADKIIGYCGADELRAMIDRNL